MRPFYTSLAAACLFMISGCASVGITEVNPGEPKAEGCSLNVYTEKSEVEREFVTACLIDSRTGTTAFAEKTAASAIENSKPAACKCGADALLIDKAGSEGASYGSWGEGKAIIKAIRFEDSGEQ